MLFRKIALIVTLFLCCHSLLQAQSIEQQQLRKNNVYLDATIAIFTQVSINYERQIHSGEKVTWYGRFGVGEAAQLSGESGAGGLGAITMLTGKKNGHLELNIGAFVGKNLNNTFMHPLINIGYRYQKPKGGFIFRANVGIIGVGLSLGYAF